MIHRTVLIAGATGLVGTEILNGLINDPTVTAIHSLGRRVPMVQHPKLNSYVVDFTILSSLPPADELYLALGTTLKTADSKAAFFAIDYNANLKVAQAALRAGVRTAGLVSAMGADARSKIFYSQTKGKLEDALMNMPFAGLVIARPSILTGDRAPLGQAIRQGEQLVSAMGKLLNFIIPLNYKPILASDVANALLTRVPCAKGTSIIHSGSMRTPQ